MPSDGTGLPFDSPIVAGLDKEFSELGDYEGLHKGIHLVECGHIHAVDSTCSTFLNIKDYMRGKAWIEVFADAFLESLGQQYSIFATVKVEPVIRNQVGITTKFRQYNTSVVKDWCYRPMFVGVIKLPQQRQQLQFRVAPSVIRLKLFDLPPYASRFGRESTPLPAIHSEGIGKGELALKLIDGGGSPEVEFPSDVVKGTSQVMSKVANHQTPSTRESYLPANEINEMLPTIILGEGIWVAIDPTLNAAFERIEVNFCSPRFKTWPVHRMHRQNSSAPPASQSRRGNNAP